MTARRQSLAPGAFYTYLWLRRDGTPYYVGKGTWQGKWHFTNERVYRKGSPPIDRIIIQEHPSEDEALFAEIFLIAFYGRKDIGNGCLRNFTDGGEGISGRSWSLDQREKIVSKLSASKKGKPIAHYDPQVHSQLMTGFGNPMYGKKRVFDERWRMKLSDGKKGHLKSEETRKKMSEAAKSRRGYRPEECYRGHKFTQENTWIGKTGSRFCLECRKIHHEAERQRNQAKRRNVI